MKAKITGGAVFERYEKKYLLNQDQYAALTAALDNTMQPDEYGKYTICTIYYDTDDFTIIRRCLEKPNFKQKLRLRSYGVARQDSTVYLELKKKMAGITYKRRINLFYTEAMAYMKNGLPPVWQGQIYNEIDWYKNQYSLDSKVLICYERVALSGKEDNQLRVTFDANIRWRDYSLGLDKGDHGAMLLPPGTRLMEVKTLRALPCWLVELFSDLEIYPTSYSKYGTVYSKCLAEKGAISNVG